MPITLSQIKNLQHLSNANFRKFVCQNCTNEFYSIRECKYCCSACKQSAYRTRLLNEEINPNEKPKDETEIKSPSKAIDFIEKLKQKEKIYNLKLKTI